MRVFRWREVDTAARELRDAAGTERALRLHELRKRAKRLRYCAEAAEPLLGPDARKLCGLLSNLQDHLGRHHDAVLATRLIETSCPADSAPVDAARQRLVDEAGEDDRSALRLLRKIRRSADLRWLR